MYIIENVTIPFAVDSPEALAKALSKRLGYTVNSKDLIIWRRSLDVRSRANIHFIYSLIVTSPGRESPKPIDLSPMKIPELNGPPSKRPVVIGLGPAGLFAGYYLAKAGLQPRIFERGGQVDSRTEAVARFWRTGELDPENNVQFGEGGAGTFSDGKLTARGKDPASRAVRDILVKHGAPPQIRYEAKAHIGTDQLKHVVKAMRESIIAAGGEIHFHSQVTSIVCRNECAQAIRLANGTKVECQDVVLAIGHSARDTIKALLETGVYMEAKPFAIGLRIEHSQEFIDSTTYGRHAGHPNLPPAEYVLTHQHNGLGCYSFCMCPGGFVVNASSESNGIVVNGMSESKRNSPWANSALVVGVDPSRFSSNHPLAGIEFQREIEKKAFNLTQGQGVPACFLKDFTHGCPAKHPSSTSVHRVVPINPDALLPEFVTETIRAAMPNFEKKLAGFVQTNPIIYAPETRTSSPVRIVRDPISLMSSTIEGLYPTGEGAGYAGGIISAAVDGLRVATAIVNKALTQSTTRQ